MAQLSTGLLLAGQALTLMAIAWLGWRLRGERRARTAAEAALAAEVADQERTVRMELLDRRVAVIAPIDTLHLSWSRGGRPDGGDLVDALKAMADARLLFPAEIGELLEQDSALLLAYIEHLKWQRTAAGNGNRFDREDLLEREFALGAGLKPKIQELRARLAAEARIGEN